MWAYFDSTPCVIIGYTLIGIKGANWATRLWRVALTTVEVLLRFGRYAAHGVLRQRRDGEAGVDARVGRHDGRIHYVKSRVVVHLAIEPHHSLFGISPEGTAA